MYEFDKLDPIFIWYTNFRLRLEFEYQWLAAHVLSITYKLKEIKWKLRLLDLQDLLKVINKLGFYSFSISHLVLELFVWYVNEINYDVKLSTDHRNFLENHVYLRAYLTKVGLVWFSCKVYCLKFRLIIPKIHMIFQ